jgi:16S rRNA (guanine527-N7)-methyltransferase
MDQPPHRVTRTLDGAYAAAGLTDASVRLLGAYRDVLMEASRSVNLTAIRDRDGIDQRLIRESLRLLPAIDALAPDSDSPVRLADVGTGAGIPGMVLAIARPGLDVTLIDATGKKVRFLEDAVRALGLANVRPVHARAEELGIDRAFRERFDLCTARAVAPIPTLLELTLPLIRIGGHALLAKGEDIGDELAAGERAGRSLGGRILEAPILPDAETTITTRLVVVEKTAPTPGAYPRRSGVPSRQPLGTASRIGHPRHPGRE